MLALSHVILHLGLCSAVAKLPPETTIAIHVHATDRADQVAVDRTFRTERGDDEDRVVEFDIGQGTFKMEAAIPKYGCSAVQYFSFLPELNRSVTMSLIPAAGQVAPSMLLDGTAPQSFLYVKPTFVLFDKNTVACGKPITDPLPSHIDVDNADDSYYASFYPDVTLPPGAVPLLAIRLKTPTHQYHYVRVPVPVPMRASGWPARITFTVNQDMVDELASDPVDTLLCPKLWSSSSG
jgi:hypothetical protein